MEATIDLSRWSEKPRGVGYRRWTIVSTGLRQLFRLRLFRILIGLAWGSGILLAALGFLFSQTVATGGWLESLATSLGPRTQALSSVVAGLITMYPDICIGGWFALIFWLHSYIGLGLSLIAITAMVPRLITRDRATHALIVYLSRPLTSADYLLGKLGMIVGVLVVMWTGPLLFGWLLSVAVAPNRDFVPPADNRFSIRLDVYDALLLRYRRPRGGDRKNRTRECESGESSPAGYYHGITGCV